ncbi:unnamed protein product, partial [Prorocentrum cordatum]
APPSWGIMSSRRCWGYPSCSGATSSSTLSQNGLASCRRIARSTTSRRPWAATPRQRPRWRTGFTPSRRRRPRRRARLRPAARASGAAAAARGGRALGTGGALGARVAGVPPLARGLRRPVVASGGRAAGGRPRAPGQEAPPRAAGRGPLPSLREEDPGVQRGRARRGHGAVHRGRPGRRVIIQVPWPQLGALGRRLGV